jgi:hypothetical protein
MIVFSLLREIYKFSLWFFLFIDFSSHYSFCVNVNITGNFSKLITFASIHEFQISKVFSINVNPANAPKIKEVLQYPPKIYWIKCNTDEAALGCQCLAACNGIYRDSYVTTFGCFVKNLGVTYAFLVEIVGVMLTIEIANRKSWNLLWIETDLLCLLFLLRIRLYIWLLWSIVIIG